MTKKTVLSTRVLPQELISQLHEKDFDVILHDFISINQLPKEKWLPKMVNFSCAVFTSQHAVKAVLSNNINLKGKLIAALSGETQRSLNEAGLSILATGNQASDLAREILKFNISTATFFCGNLHRDELPTLLLQHGVVVNKVIVYNTQLTPHRIAKHFDAVLFFSPSAVNSFYQQNDLPKNAVCFCIGQTTASALKSSPARIVVATNPSPHEVITKVLHHEFN
jgi:uroporphyrinogen-III synthase